MHSTDPEYSEAMYGARCNQARMDSMHADVVKRFKREVAAGAVQVIRATSDDVAALIEDWSLDWVYIDGDHTYEFVKRDLEQYLPKVRKGGIIFGDDYHTYVGEWFKAGVVKAVDEFVAGGTVEALLLTNTFVLRKL
jgi:predicted O-methyltransferase YrrM